MRTLILIAILLITFNYLADTPTHRLDIKLGISEELSEQLRPNGRLFVFLSQNPRGEPRQQLWPLGTLKNYMFATNLSSLPKDKIITLNQINDWHSTADFEFKAIPEGEYFLQVLWDQNHIEASINATGNLYSQSQKLEVNAAQTVSVVIDQQVPEPQQMDHELIRFVDLPSALLSKFWGEPRSVKFSVLLPRGYSEGDKTYYSRYNIAGYGGRYHRVNRLMANEKFSNWWQSDDAPEVINIFLDGDGPLGDSYQLDSANSGPYGQVLIEEIIPYVEANFRAKAGGDYRFADGCSTGGWVSLALQIFYPEEFNGIWSYSPDAVEFSNYQTINIYKDDNALINEWGNVRPIARDLAGDVMLTVQEFIRQENVLAPSGTYVDSGFQLGAHAALYGPRGENGLPKPLFDAVTGSIDPEVAEYWKRYDLAMILRDNWETLGPQLKGKIYLWMGDMDNFYLNPASRVLAEFLANTTEPKSDAVFEFEPMTGHCSKFSNTRVLGQISERIESLQSR